MITGRARLAGLDSGVRGAADWALKWADYYGVPISVTSGYRSWADQARLRRKYEACVAQGTFRRTPDCQYPANMPGDSAHNYGWAWDSVTDPGYQSWWTAVREMAGFEVLQHDIIHAQVPNWRQYR